MRVVRKDNVCKHPDKMECKDPAEIAKLTKHQRRGIDDGSLVLLMPKAMDGQSKAAPPKPKKK